MFIGLAEFTEELDQGSRIGDSISRPIVRLLLVVLLLAAVPAQSRWAMGAESPADGIELVDGFSVPGEVVMTDHAGLVIIRSTQTWMAQSFPRKQVHAITKDGKRKTVNPKRKLTEEDKKYLDTQDIDIIAQVNLFD